MKRAVIAIKRDQAMHAVLAASAENFVKAWRTGQASDPIATFTFASPAQLFSVISPKRWELIETLQRLGPSSVRGLARSLGRDVKRVHEDVRGLLDWGIIERTETGKVCVPYDVIHADFDLRAVA
jgi:predicted transcriptional regulator